MRGCLAVALLVAACGGGTSAPPPDASTAPDAPPADAGGFAACAGFEAAGVAVPAHVVTTLGNPDVESPSSCASIDAPFGIESAGPDRVIPVTNLVAGQAYVARVTSASDLAFYVATGCSTPSGPASDQCLLFQDGTSAGVEVGRFVATAPTAYVVVDFYASQPPPSLEFTLDVYPEQCADDTGCAGATPACFAGQCVGCVSSFDCTSAQAPVCGANQACVAGGNSCSADDTAEPQNDGPAGAFPIALDGAGRSQIVAATCSSPTTEADFFAFDVTTLGEIWDLRLAWNGPRDLDLAVYDASGQELGLSYWEQPERVRLTYLPLGRYYVRVHEFAASPSATALAYTLTTQRTLGSPCGAASDCAAEYRNQLFRGACQAGACVAIDGAGAVPETGACDSQADCTSGLSCASFLFVADADTRATCARPCSDDAGCAALGPDHVCTTYLASNFCVQKCSADDHCPISISTEPPTGPWTRLRCDLPTGRCQP